MNKKPKLGTVHDATKATQAKTQGVREPTQRNTQKWRTNKEKNKKETSSITTLSKITTQQDYARYAAMAKNTEEEYSKPT